MKVSVRPSLRGAAASVVLSALALGTFSVSQAEASLVALGACDASPVSRPFLRWADSNSYKLVPGGDFESSKAGWSLSGPAARVAGSEPAAATGRLGRFSLALPGGASAQSPGTCVNAAYPSFRFFARTSTVGSLAVSVVYQTLLGPVTVSVGVVILSARWAPTMAMLTASAVPALLTGGTTKLALRFTTLTGSAQIDDVYVDPHRMH